MTRWSGLARWALGVAVTANLLAAVGVLAVRSQDRATSLDVRSAVEEYRRTAARPTNPDVVSGPTQNSQLIDGATTALPTTAAPTSPVAPPQTDAGPLAATTVVTSPPEPSTPRAPEAGVYVYDTSGYEEVDALGGARHDYPAETTITYTTNDCGIVERWAPLTQRADSRLLCPGSAGDELRWFRTEREFYGRTVDFRFDCPENSTVRPTTPTPGEQHSFTCRTGDRGVSTVTVTIHDHVPVTIDNQEIRAVHVELHSTSSGDGHATTSVDMLVHPDTGLVLARTVATDAEAPSPAGKTTYTERYTIQLRSLQPLR